MANRFAPLNVEQVLGEDNTHHSGSTPRASHHPTPVASRAPSPTPTLFPAYVPETWRFGDATYTTLEEAIRASATPFDIHDDVIEWMIQVIQSFSSRDIGQVYNALGTKIYEHRDALNTSIETLSEENQALRNDIDSAKATIRDVNAKADQAIQENVTLHNNQGVLLQAIQKLSKDVASLTTEVTTLRVANLFSAPAPTNTVFAPSSSKSRPKVADPPKYKGNKSSDITLEQWLQKLGVWFRYQGIVLDDDKITTALMYLEGGAHSYMDDYAEKAALGDTLGTWQNFIDRLKSGYRQLSPEKSAQQSLDELCSKQHSSMATFAEGFRLHAVKSGYSDVELIRRIDQQRSREMRMVMTTVAQVNPAQVATTWETYLEWALDIEMKMREQGKDKHIGGTSSGSRSTPKDPNSMDIDAVKKAEKLSREQMEWQSKGLCFRCGKHRSLRKGEKCRTPKYTGFYELPPRPSTSTQARVVEEESENKDTEREDFIRAALEKFDKHKEDKGKGKEKEITTAHIEEVNETDFLLSML